MNASTLAYTAEAPSPFFKSTNLQFAWDSTSLGYLKECPRKYQLTILEGWRKRDESVHLIFGGHYAKGHEIFQQALADGMEYDDAVDATVDFILRATWDWENGVPWEPDHNTKTRSNLLRSLIWYFEEFRHDPAKTLILEDGKAAVELTFKMQSGIECVHGEFLLSGHMDRIVDYDGTQYVMDQKTSGSTLGAYFFNKFNPNNQMSLYTLAGQVVYDMPVAGVIIDAAQIAVGFTAFSRGMTLRSAGQLDEFLNNFGEWMKVAELYAERGFYPMNEASCHNYSGCSFVGICGKDPKVRDLFLKTDFEKRFWNPLEDR